MVNKGNQYILIDWGERGKDVAYRTQDGRVYKDMGDSKACCIDLGQLSNCSCVLSIEEINRNEALEILGKEKLKGLEECMKKEEKPKVDQLFRLVPQDQGSKLPSLPAYRSKEGICMYQDPINEEWVEMNFACMIREGYKVETITTTQEQFDKITLDHTLNNLAAFGTVLAKQLIPSQPRK